MQFDSCTQAWSEVAPMAKREEGLVIQRGKKRKCTIKCIAGPMYSYTATPMLLQIGDRVTFRAIPPTGRKTVGTAADIVKLTSKPPTPSTGPTNAPIALAQSIAAAASNLEKVMLARDIALAEKEMALESRLLKIEAGLLEKENATAAKIEAMQRESERKGKERHIAAEADAQGMIEEAKKLSISIVATARAETAAWQAEQALIDTSHAFKGDFVKLNIGGSMITTRLQTLTEGRAKETYFAALLSGRHKLDEDEIIIDRDGRAVHHLMNYFRGDFTELDIPGDAAMLQLLIKVEYMLPFCNVDSNN
jgi:hypothetical protein